jgi:hypothetical protein
VELSFAMAFALKHHVSAAYVIVLLTVTTYISTEGDTRVAAIKFEGRKFCNADSRRFMSGGRNEEVTKYSYQLSWQSSILFD